MQTNTVVTLAIVIFVHAGYCAAVKCYDCSVTNCEDPFNKSGHTLTDGCAQCMKTKAQTNGVQAVGRGCLTSSVGSNECQKMSVQGVDATVCYCSTDGCNGGSSVYVSMATIFFPLLVLAKHPF
ncbi:uncharacterized protein LOC127858618 [Dreissena polymorpha]|uniref:uncharacterized protein LOC127858618 n=1 Tax=Dreissena polymorpha TaxID=45954 RepID=UPI002264AF5E|nr:uncharacterized protein LOC127858618 [Dreissena polymorpha]